MIEHPKMGELWIHKQHGYTCIVLGMSEIRYSGDNISFIVEYLRGDSQAKLCETLGTFTWCFDKLETIETIEE